VFTHPLTTRGGVRYGTGDLLLAVSPTDLCPHGEVGPFGHNWDCISLHDRSVWSTLEYTAQVQTVHHVRDLTPEEVGVWGVMAA
jgi:hypothetical protein